MRPVTSFNNTSESLRISKDAHEKDDVDFEARSHHHTLGKGPTQAATGNHTHTVVSTTAALASITNAINTIGKYEGLDVWNRTTGKPVWAVGGLAGDVWKDATGAVAHTPV